MESNQRFEFRVEETAQQRLDHCLARLLPQFSRSRLQSIIKMGGVRIAGERASKAGQLVPPGVLLSVEIPAAQSSGLQPENTPLDVLFEDHDVIVVNKPAGMVVHPGAGHSAGTLANAALGHDPNMLGVGGEHRPGIVHRLDKQTSGLIILAKNDAALDWLQGQFQERNVRKTYLALVDGCPASPRGRVEAPIGRDPSHRKRMSVLPEGKGRAAVSDYYTREVFSSHTLLEVHPVTGRTHQVRLHCALLGCPVAGDTIYGRKKPTIKIDRHFLHAWKLDLLLPSEPGRRIFEAPLPAELEETLDELRARRRQESR
ncbi:MAG TPA: RluA family pseudouridine synthase [Anaerolineales bacterium]|nr:RluA family pseudouridine synthase [Anaerolineales bacterium]